MHRTEQQLRSAMADSLEKGAQLLVKMAKAEPVKTSPPGKKINLSELRKLAHGPRTDS